MDIIYDVLTAAGRVGARVVARVTAGVATWITRLLATTRLSGLSSLAILTSLGVITDRCAGVGRSLALLEGSLYMDRAGLDGIHTGASIGKTQ